MTLITNNILISFIEKNISIFDKIGNIDLNIYHVEEKPINKLIKFNKIIDIFFNNLKYYQYFDNLKFLKINGKTHNISLISSIIYCIYSQYNDKNDHDKEIFIKNLIEKLIGDVFIKFTEFEYSKLKWKKNDIVENINNNKYDYKVLKYLSDYFVINIFIVDDDKIYFCGGNNFIQFRKNIFIVKTNDLYCPIFNEYKKTFSLSDKIIQNINNNLDKINLYFFDLPLKIYIEPIIKIKKNVKFDDDKSTDKKIIEYTDTLNGFDIDTECESIIDKSEKEEIGDIDKKPSKKTPIFSEKQSETQISSKEIVKSFIVKGNTKNSLKKLVLKELQEMSILCGICIYKSCGKKFKTKQELIDNLFE